MASIARAVEHAWTLLLAVAARRRGDPSPGAAGFRAREDGTLERVGPDDARAELVQDDAGLFTAGSALSRDIRDFVELYLPMLGRRDGESWVIAHLGQSVDGHVATASGHSAALTGRADFVHMHRLRALADAVLVGAGTVDADDPRLTTRLVTGPSPTRVVIDPDARLDRSRGVFTDGAAPTIRVHAADARHRDTRTPPGALVIARDADGLCLPDLLAALRVRDLRTVFIEGGGVTVTRWLEAGLLDRLHLVVAPVLTGEGRRALSLPAVASMDESRRPHCRLHLLGQDVLWDFDLRREADDDAPAGETIRRISGRRPSGPTG